jgi:hypothetical protein
MEIVAAVVHADFLALNSMWVNPIYVTYDLSLEYQN